MAPVYCSVATISVGHTWAISALLGSLCSRGIGGTGCGVETTRLGTWSLNLAGFSWFGMMIYF